MNTIALTKGLVAIVDDADYERLAKFKWCAAFMRNTYYAVHRACANMRIPMHRLILYAPRGIVVDHINGDTLDNRRGNLRLATHAQNGRNRNIDRTNTSGFKGVSFNKRERRWSAYIRFRGKKRHLGYFDTPKEAARAYDRAARLAFGRFARTNFPQVSRVKVPSNSSESLSLASTRKKLILT